jgi:uncharacterized membrane protein
MEMNQVLETIRTGDWQDSGSGPPWTVAVWDEDEDEVLGLQSKVSALAMQKQYWWQQCTEVRDALRVADAEVKQLREALARTEGASTSR